MMRPAFRSAVEPTVSCARVRVNCGLDQPRTGFYASPMPSSGASPRSPRRSVRLMLGGFGGVCVVDAADCVSVSETWRPLLRDWRLFNERVVPGADAPLRQGPGFFDRITLNYRQNVVRLGLTAPVFRNASLLNL